MNRLKSAVNIRHGKLKSGLEVPGTRIAVPGGSRGHAYVRTPVRWTMPVERIERITQLRRREQSRMKAYMEARAA